MEPMREPASEFGFMSTAEFNAFEDTRPHTEKWELIEGRPVMMTGGTARHSSIIGNITRSLGNRLRGGPCRLYVTDMKVENATRAFAAYPDVVVRCAEPPLDLERAMHDPTMVFEVLSPSTQDYDLALKKGDYTRIGSLQLYVAIFTDERRVQAWTRSGDTFQERRHPRDGEMVALPSGGLELPLDEVYEGVAELS